MTACARWKAIIYKSHPLPRNRKISLESSPSSESQQHDGDVASGIPPSENKLYYPALDGLRAVAIVMVFFEHYESSIHQAFNWGWAGVDVFFVLSGFLITGILFDTCSTPHRYRNFYVRRTLRIFPLYYAALLLGVLLTPVFHWLWNPAWILWFSYLGNYARFVFLNSPLMPRGAIEHLIGQPMSPAFPALYLGHFWSLCVEEQFYLVWPLVVFSVRDRVRLRNLCLLFSAFALLARVACIWFVPQPYITAELLYRATPLRVDALLLGGFVALSLRGARPEADRIRKIGNAVLLLFPLFFLLWEYLYRRFSGLHHVYYVYPGAPVLSTIGYTLIDIFCAAFILHILKPRGPIFHLLNLAPLRALGQISYGFYVFHDMFHGFWRYLSNVLFGASNSPWHGRSVVLFGFFGTILLASLSFRFFETPFLRLKSRFTA